MIKFFFLFLFFSCSAFKPEEDLRNQEGYLLEESKKINYCQSNKFQLIGASSFAVKTFGKYLKKEKNLSSYEKFSLWALFQMNIHPDSSSPQSKLQIFVWDKQNLSYFEYDGNDLDSTPFLDGLSDFLIRTKQKKSLMDLAEILDKDFNFPVPIGSELAEFLRDNREKIQKDPNFKLAYFKANHLITEKETLPHLNFKELLKKRTNKIIFTPTLFSDSYMDTSINCNKNLSIMKEFIGQSGYSNHFAIKDNQTVILGLSSLTPDSEKSFGETFIFSKKNTNYRPILCSLKKGDSFLLFSSGKGKGPGQLLYHLLETDLETKTSLEDLDNELNNLRYITLRSPKRVVLEARRPSKDGLTKFLNSPLPVYSVPSLGNLWGYASLKNGDGFIKDSRNESYLFCE
jgi:hypothetical protein